MKEEVGVKGFQMVTGRLSLFCLIQETCGGWRSQGGRCSLHTKFLTGVSGQGAQGFLERGRAPMEVWKGMPAKAERREQEGCQGADRHGYPSPERWLIGSWLARLIPYAGCIPGAFSRHVQSSCRSLAGAETRRLLPRNPCSPGTGPAEMHP